MWKDFKEIGINTRNWVDAAQDTDHWRALVNAALILQVHGVISCSIYYYYSFGSGWTALGCIVCFSVNIWDRCQTIIPRNLCS